MAAGFSLLTTWGGRIRARQFCIWQLPLWLATNSEAMGLDIQKSIWAHLDSQKVCNPSQITSIQLQKSISFPQQYHGRLCLCCFPHAYLLCMLYCCPAALTITLWGLWIWSQGTGRHRCHSAQSSATIAFFCMFVLLFSFSNSVKLLFLSTRSLSLSSKPFPFFRFPK